MSLAAPQDMDYPVHVEVASPPRHDRIQLLIRIGIAIALGAVGITTSWLVGVLYIALPVFAAIAISTEGSEKFTSVVAPKVWRVLAWLLRLSAYMAFLADRFPAHDDRAVTPTLQPTGHPTVGNALARLVTSLPSGIVMLVLSFLGAVLWIVAALTVLVDAKVPELVLAFQRGLLRWQARLVAYHASLVAEYPPWAFDMGTSSTGGIAAAGAR
jgi:hypothetical protein